MPFTTYNSIHKAVKVPFFRLILNYLLLFLLFFSFNTQHVLASSIYERADVGSTATYHFFAENNQHNLFFKNGIPSNDILSAVEMELEEDDEVSHSSDVISIVYSRKSTTFEIFYRSLIRTKYLQLVTILNQQPADPLFLLHHSWKYSIA